MRGVGLKGWKKNAVMTHCLELQLRDVGCLQNHPVDRLQEQTNFIGDAVDRVGRVVDELNKWINLQDVQINQLADMVNDLVGKTEGQTQEIKDLQADREVHRKCQGHSAPRRLLQVKSYPRTTTSLPSGLS
jgi:hypothetical protein